MDGKFSIIALALKKPNLSSDFPTHLPRKIESRNKRSNVCHQNTVVDIFNTLAVILDGETTPLSNIEEQPPKSL